MNIKIYLFVSLLLLNFARPNLKAMSIKGSVTTADYLPYEDYKRLVQCLIDDKKYWWACYCVLSFCTGLRFSDVSRLKWKDVIDKQKIIITAKKTKKTHVIPIGNNASEHLDSLYNYMGRPSKESYILERKRCGGDKPVSIQYINRTLKSWIYIYDLNIENFSTHTFRKTFGRYIYEKGGCSEKILLYLNRIFKHTDMGTTMTYLGIRNDEISKIFNSIEL